MNLFVTSFRFNQPMASLYRVAMPFLAILVGCLLVITYVPSLSTIGVRSDIALAKAKAKAKELREPPHDAWLLECVQHDRNNPQPCTDEDKRIWGNGERSAERVDPAAQPQRALQSTDEGERELLDIMMGEADEATAPSSNETISDAGATADCWASPPLYAAFPVRWLARTGGKQGKGRARAARTAIAQVRVCSVQRCTAQARRCNGSRFAQYVEFVLTSGAAPRRTVSSPRSRS